MNNPQQEAAQRLKAVQQNCELLRMCFNTLQSLIKELNHEKNGLAYCEAFTLAATSKYVYERWEREKRKLPGQKPPSADFAPPPAVQMSDKLRKEIHQSIKDSTFYTTVTNGKYTKTQ